MAIRSYFFDSVAGDRLYSAADFAKAFGIVLGNGCIPIDGAENLGFTLTGTNYTTVGAGKAVINGRFVEVVDSEIITPPAGSYNGMLVIRIDAADERKAILEVKGDRILNTEEELYEFPLWDVVVTNGVIGSITDRRVQGGAIAKVPPIPTVPDNLVQWSTDTNGVRVNMGKFAGTGKPVILYLTSAQPAASSAEHRVWVQIDKF
jgi:hypothetical protein